MLLIIRATVLTPDQQQSDAAVLIDGERIVAVGRTSELLDQADAVLDVNGLVLAPGWIDLQLNGAFGHDFTADPASIWSVAEQLPRYGVTAFLPTIITSPLETVAAAQAVLAAGPPPGFVGAQPLGLHLEGPFLSPHKPGAHPPQHLRAPTLAAVADWSPDSGVRLVTLAPELAGADAVIAALVERGVVVSAGHSLATAEQAQAGFGTGIRAATHLFNAMPALLHRDPGLAGAALADERICVGLIPDGLHVDRLLVRLVWRLLGAERLALVTDAMAALGMPPGTYQLGDSTVTVDASSARLADGRLAGSVLSLDAALRNLCRFAGCSLAQAMPTVSATPARLLGLSDYGRLRPGARADLVLLTEMGQVVATWVGGRIVHGELAAD